NGRAFPTRRSSDLSKAELLAAIEQAKAVFNDEEATTTDVAQAEAALDAAMQTFRDKVITRVEGDANNDNRFSVGDLAIVATAYGMTASDEGWDLVKAYDFNDDDKIDIEDLVWLAAKILN